jgi:hypothetical protein
MERPIVGVHVQVYRPELKRWLDGTAVDMGVAGDAMTFLVHLDGNPAPNPNDPDAWFPATLVRIAIVAR